MHPTLTTEIARQMVAERHTAAAGARRAAPERRPAGRARRAHRAHRRAVLLGALVRASR